MTKTAERPDWRPRRRKRTGERSTDVPPPAGDYLTLAQVAKELSVSERQVLRWAREQGAPGSSACLRAAASNASSWTPDWTSARHQ